jgi:hypothetical protein
MFGIVHNKRNCFYVGNAISRGEHTLVLRKICVSTAFNEPSRHQSKEGKFNFFFILVKEAIVCMLLYRNDHTRVSQENDLSNFLQKTSVNPSKL